MPLLTLNKGAHNVGKQDYGAFNQRNIYQKITDKRGLLLSLDALDFIGPDGYPAPAMKLRCYTYDANREAGSKMTGQVDTYLPLPVFLRFIYGVLQGDYIRLMEHRMETTVTDQGGAPLFEYFSGTPGDPPVSKRLTLVPGRWDAMPDFAFHATSGPGRMGETGMIFPAAGAKPTQNIFIHMSYDELCEMCLIGQVYTEAFIHTDLSRRLAIIRDSRNGDRGSL